MYKVFFNDRLFHIKKAQNVEQDVSDKSFHVLFDRFMIENVPDTVFETSDPSHYFERLKAKFHFMEAAGGLVFNQKNEFLYIERLGVPDLPKGKTEKGETSEQTAIREVEEECGISNLKIEKALEPSYHIYFQKRMILKKTYWFEMLYESDISPKPQIEEQITVAQFVPVDFANVLQEKTYRNLKHLFRYASEHKGN